MAIRIKITYAPSVENSKINYINSDFGDINNISNPNLLRIKSSGANPFILGFSKLNDGSTYLNNYSGIIPRNARSDENGNTDYQFSLDVKKIKVLAIWFDITRNEYATNLIINGVEYINDDVFFYKTFEEEQDYIDIKITKWSKPNSYISIDSILNEIEEYYDKNSIKNLVIGQEIASDNKMPNFSVIGQYGSFDIIDKNRSIREYMKEGLLRDTSVINIYNEETLIGTFESEKWNTNSEEEKYSITLKNGIEKFSDIIVPKIKYKSNQTALDLIYYLFTFTNLQSIFFDNDIKNKLQNILITNFYSESNDLLTQLNKFCNLTMTCIYINANGEMGIIDYV